MMHTKIDMAVLVADLKQRYLYLTHPCASPIIDLGTMANERATVDVCMPPQIPLVQHKVQYEDKDSLNRGGERVEYTLKPTSRAYASTARYVDTSSFHESITKGVSVLISQ